MNKVNGGSINGYIWLVWSKSRYPGSNLVQDVSWDILKNPGISLFSLFIY